MTDQPRKRITIDAPDSATILAARHLDATEGRVQVGTTVDSATRAAISQVLRYVSTAHKAPAAAAEAERDQYRAAILDIDAHATPIGLANQDDPDGNPHHYAVTVGALHRALGKVGNTAASCTAEAERDGAYRERAHLVALVASVAEQAVIAPAPDVDDPGWQILYITLHGRQCSWHIAPRDADLFEHLDHVGADDPRAQWDGHTTDEKYRHIDWIARALGTTGPFRAHSYLPKPLHGDHVTGGDAYRQAVQRIGSSGPKPAAAHATAPARITDPEWLRQQYAAAMYRLKCPYGNPWENTLPTDRPPFLQLADAILAVRDRDMERMKILVAASESPGHAVRMAAQYADKAIENGERADQLAAALREIDPAKLDLLADWFDTDDARRGPGRDVQVQADLRRWARSIRAVTESEEQP